MSNTIIVFSGPTMHPSLVEQLLPGSRCFGPAACGDVYRATRLRPHAIALIDGYFDHRLSVWHKELLWALANGVRVYGGASIGALRAVELAEHGMIGVGEVYEQFLAGALEDDDEVAVAHAEAEYRYAQQSDALVNIRATLRAARHEGVIDMADEDRLIAAGKALFYPDRNFRTLLMAEVNVTPERRARLRDWLNSGGVVDQKAADARALLSRVQLELTAQPLPGASKVKFVPTNYWEALKAQFERPGLVRFPI